MRINRIAKMGFMMAIVALFFIQTEGFSQHTVSGVVTDANTSETVPGVNILIKGTNSGTSTNVDGRYELSVPSPSDTLVFSYIGYQTQVIPIDERTEIDIMLQPEIFTTDELIVVGYGTVTRSDLTGSVSSVSAGEMNAGVNTKALDQIQGRIPGVLITSQGGAPDAGHSVRIRGMTSISAGTDPLYVIDGVPSSDPGTNINPSDIKSIDILKDASAAAIYGSRGANGVIIITTKSGNESRDLINYSGYVGFQSPARKLNLLNAQEYMEVLNAIIDEGGGSESERVTGIQNGGTDWQEAVFDRGSMVVRNEFSYSGGSDKTQYYVSLSAQNQPGFVIESGMDKYIGRVNINSNVSDKFDFGVRLNLAKSDIKRARTGGFNTSAGILNTSIHFDPTVSIYNTDGEFNRSEFIDIENPVAVAFGNDIETNSNDIFVNVDAEYDLFPFLSFKINTAYSNISSNTSSFRDSKTTEFGEQQGGSAELVNFNSSEYLLELTANYRTEFKQNSLNILVGTTGQYFDNRSFFSSVTDFSTDATGADNLGFGNPDNRNIGSNRSTHGLLSYIGRLNFNHDDRYLFTGTLRVDGSSRFGDNNKYGFFPSFAAGWQLKNEAFMQNVDFVNSLKVRGSWGKTGNEAIGNYEYLATFGEGNNTVLGNGVVNTLQPERLENQDLQWETTEQIDIGLDFELFEDRVYGTVDYYQKNTSDMLLNLPVARETGFNSRRVNIGGVRNSGFEFLLGYKKSAGNFQWSPSVQFSTIKNEITNLGPLNDIIDGNTIQRLGAAINSIYGYEVIGTWQLDDDFSITSDNVSPGDTKYRDVNGDGTITEADRVILGNGFPKFSYGFSNTFIFKNIALDFLIYGERGMHRYNVNLRETFLPFNFRRNKFADPYLNRWTPDNPTNDYPSFVNPTGQGQKNTSSYTVQNASYVSLDNLKLSYSFPQTIIGSKIRSLSMYASGKNLIVISEGQFDGDPTVTSPSNSYYVPRIIMLGIDLGL